MNITELLEVINKSDVDKCELLAAIIDTLEPEDVEAVMEFFLATYE